jgi:hypothetical protein
MGDVSLLGFVQNRLLNWPVFRTFSSTFPLTFPAPNAVVGADFE